MSLVKHETSATLNHVGKRPSPPTYLFPYKRKVTTASRNPGEAGISKSNLQKQSRISTESLVLLMNVGAIVASTHLVNTKLMPESIN